LLKNKESSIHSTISRKKYNQINAAYLSSCNIICEEVNRMDTWMSKPCFTERAVADSGRAIVSSTFPQLSPVSKRLTSCNNVIRPLLEGITQSTFHVD
jgi:hypothetical protein